MTVKAKELVNGKFWIVEEDGVRIGTLSLSDDRFLFSSKDGSKFFDNEHQLKKTFGKSLEFLTNNITQIEKNKEVHGYPTSSQPHNPIFDVKRKLPLFTKSEKSKSLYCAGYYTIKFEKGWVKSFCPKLITIERYENSGPFKTEFEMKQELKRVSAKRSY